MFHSKVATSLQNVEKSHQIALQISIGIGDVSAQSMQEEYLSGVTVYGGNGWTHCGCGEYVSYSYYDYHRREECTAVWERCSKCHVQYPKFSAHSCNGSVSGGGSSNNGRGGGGSSSGTGGSVSPSNKGGSGGASSSGQNSNQNKNSGIPNQKENYNYLKSMDGVTVTLVRNLPNALHIQFPETHDCVPRAIAFMLELKNPKGFNYDEVLKKLKELAGNQGVTFKNNGFPFVPSDFIETVYKEKYGVVGLPLSESAIISYIKKGIPVAIGVNDPNPRNNHMVTIIGFDNENFYLAAGNKNGYANSISKADLRDPDKRKWFTSNFYIIQ